MFGNIHNKVLQCFINCLLLLMRIRTNAPGLRRSIYRPIVREEWELHMSLLSYISQVAHYKLDIELYYQCNFIFAVRCIL